MDKPFTKIPLNPNEPDARRGGWLLQDTPPAWFSPGPESRADSVRAPIEEFELADAPVGLPAAVAARRSSRETAAPAAAPTSKPDGRTLRRRPSSRSGRGPPSGDRRCSCSSAGAAAFLLLLYFAHQRRALRAVGADLRRRVPGGRRAQLSDPDHPRTAGANHPRAGRPRLLRRPVASSSALSPDVAAAQRQGPGLAHFASYEGFKNYWSQAARPAPRGPCRTVLSAGLHGRGVPSREECGEDRDRRAVQGEGAGPRPPGERARSGAFPRSAASSAGPTGCGTSTTARWPSGPAGEHRGRAWSTRRTGSA